MSSNDYYNQDKGAHNQYHAPQGNLPYLTRNSRLDNAQPGIGPPPYGPGQSGYYPQQPPQAYQQGGYPQQGGYAPQPQPQVVYVSVAPL
jgi:hypothetical protein